MADKTNGVAAVLGKEESFVCETLEFTADSQPLYSAVGEVLFLPPIAQGPGCESQILQTCRPVVDWLSGLGSIDQKVVCASCTSVLLLAEAGVLDGNRATSTWWLLKFISHRYPKIDLRENSMLEVHDSCMTSSGPYSYVYLVLQLVERFMGLDAARLCSKIAVIEPGRPVNGIFVVPSLFTQSDPLMARAQEIISRDLSEGLTVANLASELGLSERTFHRRVKKLLDMSPTQMIAATRIEVAKTLLETSSDPVATISKMVGFEEVASLRGAFSKVVGMTPSAYRARMNSNPSKLVASD